MRLKLLLAIAFLAFAGAPVCGQGVIIPRDCHRCPPIPRPAPLPRVLKVKSVKITTKIEAQAATTRVEQVFENDTPYTLEGSYFFPIPESASVTDFAIYDGDKRMAGEVVERGKARQIYNDIVRRMIDPGLLEYAGKDLFQASVFPINPRSTRKIELTYSQVLRNEGGTVAYRYALGAGRRIQPQPVGQIAASVEIHSPIDIKNIYSPSHKISVSRVGERRARLSFEGAGEEAQKDFLLYYALSEKEFGLSLLTHRQPGKDGYFLMLVSPRAAIGEADRLPKDVVFVFDTSGSMSGAKIDKAKAALRFGVESLGERDRFNIIAFSGEERLLNATLQSADRAARGAALKFIDRLEAQGGTNINDALVAAFRQFEAGDRPRMVVFLTDGQPTVGATDIKEIVRNVGAANRAAARLFSFGVGYDVNVNLLDQLAGEHRGTSDYIEPDEDIEVKVSSFFAKVNYPVLADLRLDFGGVEAELIYPRALPDLFRGSQLTLVGRYRNTKDAATVRLIGKVGGREQTFTFAGQRFPSEADDNAFLPRLWATRRVGFLLEQIRLNGQNKELVDEIVQLGTRFGIVTPYTSFLVTEDGDMARQGARPPGQRMPRRMAPIAPGASMATGQEAVTLSRAENEMKLADALPTVDLPGGELRAVGAKTFHLKDGVWTDSEFNPSAGLPVVEVTFGGEAFFALLAREPRLGDYFALGRKVVVVLDGKVYRVN